MKPRVVVTRPSLPPIEEYARRLESVWESGIMTHHGPLVQELERELRGLLDVPDVACVANGTCALQLAIRALDLEGEIITTPFSYVATPAIIAWERCRPVFADIDPHTWNVDPDEIERHVNERTTAIMPVHVFGAPCDTGRIGAIARRHGLRVIYDAAHAMSVELGGRSVLSYGDVSCVSFHATKLFTTSEGGACVSADPAVMARIKRMRFFGQDDAREIVDVGMNAKMTEVEAALGLTNLPRLPAVRANRRAKYEQYLDALSGASFLTFQRFDPAAYNYGYMPVVFDAEERLLRATGALEAEGIHARRYFNPSLNTVPVFAPQDSMPVSERIARTVLCLPLYDALPAEEIARICEIVTAC